MAGQGLAPTGLQWHLANGTKVSFPLATQIPWLLKQWPSSGVFFCFLAWKGASEGIASTESWSLSLAPHAESTDHPGWPPTYKDWSGSPALRGPGPLQGPEAHSAQTGPAPQRVTCQVLILEGTSPDTTQGLDLPWVGSILPFLFLGPRQPGPRTALGMSRSGCWAHCTSWPPSESGRDPLLH